MFQDGKKYKFKKSDFKVLIPKVNENQEINSNIIPNFPINKPIKFNQSLMVKAINFGMILLISYRGEDDKWKSGRERTIQPMVLGVNRNTKNMILRGWHLHGESVSKHENVEKVWRLFKTDNIINMTFTGKFSILSPKGYKMNDRHMTDRIIASADFSRIKRNQSALQSKGHIQAEDDVTITTDNRQVIKIEVTNTNSTIDLKAPYKNNIINKDNLDLVRFRNNESTKSMRFAVMKSMFGNLDLILVGANGTEGRQVKLFDKKEQMGNYRCIKTFLGSELDNYKNVNGRSVFDLYVFNRKL